jgi:hypothetical protein
LARLLRGARRFLESRRRGFSGIEGFDEKIRNRARVRFVADKAHDMRRVVGREAFEHARD